jgi:hypothetical protein
MNLKNKKAVTLVELLVAAGIALVGITIALTLAADVMRAGASVRQRNVESAEAAIAMERLRGEISASQAFAQNATALAVTDASGNGTYWQPITLQGTAILARYAGGASPALSNAVATKVYGLSASQGTNAITLAMSVGIGQNKRKIQEVIRQWGQTIF